MFDLKTNKQDVMETFPKQKNYSLKYMNSEIHEEGADTKHLLGAASCWSNGFVVEGVNQFIISLEVG